MYLSVVFQLIFLPLITPQNSYGLFAIQDTIYQVVLLDFKFADGRGYNCPPPCGIEEFRRAFLKPNFENLNTYQIFQPEKVLQGPAERWTGIPPYRLLSDIMRESWGWIASLQLDSSITSNPAFNGEVQRVAKAFDIANQVMASEFDKVWHPEFMQLLRHPREGSSLLAIKGDEERLMPQSYIQETAVKRAVPDITAIISAGGGDPENLSHRRYVYGLMKTAFSIVEREGRDLLGLVKSLRTISMSMC
jgi:hypothetical protein